MIPAANLVEVDGEECYAWLVEPEPSKSNQSHDDSSRRPIMSFGEYLKLAEESDAKWLGYSRKQLLRGFVAGICFSSVIWVVVLRVVFHVRL